MTKVYDDGEYVFTDEEAERLAERYADTTRGESTSDLGRLLDLYAIAAFDQGAYDVMDFRHPIGSVMLYRKKILDYYREKK